MSINDYFLETASLLKKCTEGDLGKQVDEAIRQISATLKGDRCVLIFVNCQLQGDVAYFPIEGIAIFKVQRITCLVAYQHGHAKNFARSCLWQASSDML